MNARAALAEAVTLAEVARRDPSDGNRRAVLGAVARFDAAGVSASGHGYNPYRDKGGKFGAGPHKARPGAGERQAAAVAKAQERVGKAKATVDKHAGKLAAAHDAKRGAIAETRAALAKAGAAGELARAKPTAKNVNAARVATNKATRAAAKVGKHEDAIGKHTEAHAKATTAHAKAVEAHATAHAKAMAGKGKARDIGDGPAAAPDRTKADAYKASSDAHNASVDAAGAGTKAAHAAAAEAHGRAAEAMTKIGNHDKAAEHADTARRHLDATGQNASVDHARRLSVAAEEASARAEMSGASGAHADAVAAHREAAQAHGTGSMADYHAQRVNEHELAASRAGARELDARNRTRAMPDPRKVTEAVAADPRRALIGQDLVPATHTGQAWTAGGKLASAASVLYKDQFSPAAQAAAREHTDHLISQYGLHNKDAGLVEAHTLHVRTDEGLAGATAAHWGHNGQIAVHAAITADIQDHALLDAKGLRDLGARHLSGDQSATEMISAHRTLVHESSHGHGPDMIRSSPRTLVEELTTEMAARKISADVHGIRTSDMDSAGAYHNYIHPAVEKLSELSGRSSSEAHEALARASISFKRSSDRQVSPTDALQQVTSSALRELGVASKAKHAALYDHMMGVANAGP